MARKSRKNTNPESEAVLSEAMPAECVRKRIPTAIYARLSVENNGTEDGESIINQIALARFYAEEHSEEFEVVGEYADNGFTGTNFERPEFTRMMADAVRGRIGCVIVKDLSRFGRNYVETGAYVENILPKLNIRLIAVNDSFDSQREEDRFGIIAPMKNVINEAYSRDVSQKIRAQYAAARKKRGPIKHGRPPYGYRRNEEKTELIPDENADYVRVAYQWSVLGVGFEQIADRLNLLGAPTPTDLVSGRPGEHCWTGTGVKKMLLNPTYSGSSCKGRFRSTVIASHGGQVRVPREEWTVHKNTHEALVPQDDFDLIWDRTETKRDNIRRVRKLSERDRENARAEFSGLAWCGECRKQLKSGRESKHAGERYTHVKYSCVRRKKTERPCGICAYDDFLRVVVMRQLNAHVRLLADRARLIRELQESAGGKDLRLSIDGQIRAAGMQLKEASLREARLYEDRAAGIIDADDYRLVQEKLAQKRREATERLNALNAKKDEWVRVLGRFADEAEGVRCNPGEDGFDGKLMRAMVERIYVYGDNRVEIVFKNQDVDKIIEEALEGCGDERGDLPSAVRE